MFRLNIEHFCETWRCYPPGNHCILRAMCCKFDPDAEVREIFRGLPVEFARYDGAGYDIGAHQHCAFEIGDAFQLSVSTRTFFHREGWLAQLLKARDYFGPGLFGVAVSRETGILHFRTYCYGMEASDWRDYPHLINSRNMTFAFEHGAFNHPSGSLLNWAMHRPHMAVACVYWDGGWREREWFDRPEIFRTGNQSNLLAFDRHTEIWRGLSPDQQAHWHNRAFREGL